MIGGISGFIFGMWFGVGPIIQAMLILMAADIVFGLYAASLMSEINRPAIQHGVTRKALQLFLVLIVNQTGVTLSEQIGVTLPVGQSVAGWFCLVEFVSILENAVKAGINIGPLARILTIAKGRAESA